MSQIRTVWRPTSLAHPSRRGENSFQQRAHIALVLLSLLLCSHTATDCFQCALDGTWNQIIQLRMKPLITDRKRCNSHIDSLSRPRPNSAHFPFSKPFAYHERYSSSLSLNFGFHVISGQFCLNQITRREDKTTKTNKMPHTVSTAVVSTSNNPRLKPPTPDHCGGHNHWHFCVKGLQTGYIGGFCCCCLFFFVFCFCCFFSQCQPPIQKR